MEKQGFQDRSPLQPPSLRLCRGHLSASSVALPLGDDQLFSQCWATTLQRASVTPTPPSPSFRFTKPPETSTPTRARHSPSDHREGSSPRQEESGSGLRGAGRPTKLRNLVGLCGNPRLFHHSRSCGPLDHSLDILRPLHAGSCDIIFRVSASAESCAHTEAQPVRT